MPRIVPKKAFKVGANDTIEVRWDYGHWMVGLDMRKHIVLAFGPFMIEWRITL